MKNLEEFLKVIEEKGRLIILSLSGLVVLLLFTVGWLFYQNEPKEMAPETELYEVLLAEEPIEEEINTIEPATNESASEATTTPTEVVVDVKGAVQTPGVYTMGASSRVVDAIAKAGGLLDSAEQKAINLAQIVADQMVIYVPEIGEEGEHIELITQTEQAPTGEEEGAENKININTAEKEALMTLNGIGSSKAENILTYREENGSFKTIEEIKEVSGIGEATFTNLKEHIVVNP